MGQKKNSPTNIICHDDEFPPEIAKHVDENGLRKKKKRKRKHGEKEFKKKEIEEPVIDSNCNKNYESHFLKSKKKRKNKERYQNKSVDKEHINMGQNEQKDTISKYDFVESTSNNILVDDLSDDSQVTTDLNELPSVRDNIQIDLSLVSEEQLHLLVPKLMRFNDEDYELLKKHNLVVQNGRFTMIENAILKRNWQRYLEDYKIPNNILLLGHFQYERSNGNDRKIKKAYQKFAQDTQLWLRLAKDLPNRTIYQIYCRARSLLSDLKAAKDLDERDRQIILDLYRKHGDHYASFCEEYGYNPKCAREIVRHMIKADGKQLKRGEWTYKEMKKLKKVVEDLIKELNLESYDGIPWSRVAQKLKRSDVQCRQRFFSKTIFTMVSQTESDWDEKLDLAKFIALLKHLNYPDQNMIDWDFIKEKFSSHFFNILLRKWRELRVRVPDYTQLSLSQILDYLYEKRVLKHYGSNPEKMKEIEEFLNSS